MPELWLFATVFLIISIGWSIIEIGIKWAALAKFFDWSSPWHSLLNSFVMQVLQFPGSVLAFLISDFLLEISPSLKNLAAGAAVFPIYFLLRFLTSTIIGGSFLFLVKKNDVASWKDSALINFVSLFLLIVIFLVILFLASKSVGPFFVT